jgi:hypothetical protein
MRYAWTCRCCGKQYDTFPLDFASEAPDYWYGLPPEQRGARAVLTPDFCTIDGEHRFIRGCLELPIVRLDRKLVFGVLRVAVVLRQAATSSSRSSTLMAR